MSGEHAVLAPSSAPQWAYCSGSVPANMHVPNVETDQSREGTAAHWVGAECLLAWRDPDGGAPSCRQWLGVTAPNGVVIDEKAVEGSQVFVDDVLVVANELGGLRQLWIEKRVHMPQIHEQNWGTLDACIVLLGDNVLYIWDYKHGHRETRAFENYQLIDYVAGLVNELSIDGHKDQTVLVHMRIVQPFCYRATGSVDEWVVVLSDLRPYFSVLHAKAHEALTNPTFTSGKHCRDCAAVGRCATARRAGYSLIDYVNEPYEIETMSGSELATERHILADGMVAAKARLEAIEDDLAHRIKGGAVDTGLALGTSSGRLKWSVPNDQVLVIAQQFGVDASRPDVKTPTQVRDQVASEMRPAFVGVLTSIAHRPAGGLKLIDASDTVAARAFGRK